MERRRFTREFKLEAVDLNVHPTQLRNWVKAFALRMCRRHEGRAGYVPGPTVPSRSRRRSLCFQRQMRHLSPRTVAGTLAALARRASE